MNKILVTIYVVATEEEYDLLLPIGKKLKDIIDAIQDSIVDLSNGNFIKKDKVVLYTKDGLIVNQNNVVKYSGLRNGCKLCLI